MSNSTHIEWTEATWNPVTGCTKISEGCDNCYAFRLAMRLKAMGSRKYRRGFQVTCHREALGLPLSWRKPRMIFVNSMGDLFHECVPTDFIVDVFGVMAEARQHTFQVLTKRAERMAALAEQLPWPDNVWAGVTVEASSYLSRIDSLVSVPARTRFISFEPLLSSVVGFPARGIDWVIAGGESGPGARPMKAEWVRELRDYSNACGVAFFFKQWGGHRRSTAGRILDGRTWDEYPAEPDLHPERAVIEARNQGHRR